MISDRCCCGWRAWVRGDRGPLSDLAIGVTQLGYYWMHLLSVAQRGSEGLTVGNWASGGSQFRGNEGEDEADLVLEWSSL